MVNINAQEWLDDKYPENGVCKRNNDLENKGKSRKSITLLDIRKGKIGNGVFRKNKNLIEDLKLEGFTILGKLVVFSHHINYLDVSDLSNLKEMDCHGNRLVKLNVKGCVNLENIDCSNNEFLRELDLSTCTKLKEVNVENCPSELTEEAATKSSLTYDDEKKKLVRGSASVKNSPRIRKAKDDDIRNILIVGITGNGKSTLSNALSNTNVFKESSSSTSATKNFQSSEIFEWQEKRYRVIDNIGFGDAANISKEDILFKVGGGIHEAKEGLNQVLFVFKDRFSEDQIIAYNLFKNFINETGITKFTTIVKTGFEDFQDPQLCKEDQELLLKQTKELKEIINSCNGIIHIDNPAISVIKESDSERIKNRNRQRVVINREKREMSRKVLLDHLVENCLEVYKLKEWESIWEMVEDYNRREVEIGQSSSSSKEQELKEVKNELVQRIEKGIKISLEANLPIPNFPIGINFGFERQNKREQYQTNIEVPKK